MYIVLTNSAPAHKGEPIAIKTDLVLSIRPGVIEREDGTVDKVTFLFVPPHGTWEVEESFEMVVEKLNS